MLHFRQLSPTVRRRSIEALELLILTLWLSTPASAQFTSGTILGTVTDPSGAVVPGATVTATH